jgi:hypothetical protein
VKQARDSLPSQDKSRRPGAELLAASVAHELNNIAATLRGFVELARDSAAVNAEPPLAGIFEEVRIGVERVAALGADLTTLAAGTASPRPVTLEECADTMDDRAAVAIRWDCAAGQRVLAAAGAARLAIGTLARFAEPDGGTSAILICHLEPAATTCVSCGANCAAGAAWFTLPQSAIRGRLAGLARPDKACLSAAELRLAALDHAIHAAGGHLLLNTGRGAISLLLPLAETAKPVT